LGVFDYDHDVWAFDWLYIDTKGNVVDNIDTYNFKVLDQIGYLVWPDAKMIIPHQYIEKNWKVGKINSYEGMNNLYIIRVEDVSKKLRMKGLWNKEKNTWEIKPEYYAITVLDAEKEIYALQKEENSLYTLYDNKNKKNKINMRKNITLITVLLTFPVIIGNNKNIVNDIYIYIYMKIMLLKFNHNVSFAEKSYHIILSQ